VTVVRAAYLGNVVSASPSQRRLAAILSADAVGFSRLMGADETGTLETLSGHRTVFDSEIERRGGRVVGSAGDSVLADFASVVAALEAAVEIQRRLAERNGALAPDRRLDFRIGINLGDVIVEGATIFGDGVNIAARLQALAPPGGIYVAGSVFDQVRNKVALGFRALGAQRVKNIAEPVRVYKVESAATAPRKVPPKPRRTAWIGIGAGAAVAAALGWWLAGGSIDGRIPREALRSGPADAPAPASATVARPVVAVLPFANLSGDAAEDYFSDGLTEDVIAALGRFSNLAVIARNSAFAYRGQRPAPSEIGRALGARYLIEGSVRRSSDRVRVAVQLIEAESGLLRWSERYDAEMKDIFSVQDEITRGVAGALAIRLTRLEEARSLVKPAANLAAYDYMLRGRQAFARATRESNFAARDLFRKAVESDPTYAPAYVGLGRTYMNAVLIGWVEDPVTALDRAEVLAEQAHALDDKSAAAHALLGLVYHTRHQREAALRQFDQAIALNPNDADVLAERGGTLVWSGRPEDGIESYETALRYDPNMNPIHLSTLGAGYYLVRRYGDAVRVLERSIQLSPDQPFSHVNLAATYAQLGRREDAAREADQVRRLHPFFEARLFGAILPDERLRAHLLDGLDKAGLQ
jgi:TolB-like protein/class 3 adenylate cyclase/Tfp pilus assembly protein PilF